MRIQLFTGRLWAALIVAGAVAGNALAQDPREIVREAIDHWRGVSSMGEMTMVIHRPDWERSMSMQAWTETWHVPSPFAMRPGGGGH